MMGAVTSYFGRRKREGEELRNKYEQALDLASLAPGGGNYMFLNVSSDNDNSDHLALTQFHKDGRNSICLAKWKRGSNHEQSFKVEPCSDYHEDCVVSCYGNKDKLQWVIGENLSLELLPYPTSGEERLRPPGKKWRFRIEEKCPPDSKMYRIVSMDDDLDGIDCLALEGTVGKSLSKLVFKRRKDDDRTQLWYLYSR